MPTRRRSRTREPVIPAKAGIQETTVRQRPVHPVHPCKITPGPRPNRAHAKNLPPLDTHAPIDLQSEYMFALADIIAQETQDGRLIVRFLISTMHGELPDSQPCHRLDAARLLVKLGFEPAQAVVDHATPRQTPKSHPRSQPPAVPETDHAAHRIRSALAEIVHDETDHGRTAVRFLVDAMQGQLPDFKPCHRLSAARELLRLGFNHDPDAQGQDAQGQDTQDQDARQATQADPEPDPAAVEAQRRLDEHIEFSRHGPIYYASYPYPCTCEDRRHDCNGNPLNDQELEKAARKSPAYTLFIKNLDDLDAFAARYADYLARHNAENPHNPIDFNLIQPNLIRGRLLRPARGP